MVDFELAPPVPPLYVGQKYMQEETPERDINIQSQGANTQNASKAGCVFFGGLFLIVLGMVLWVLLYGLVMLRYEVTRPGGHHFGGGDLAAWEAIAAGIIAGPFVGLAICSLCFRGLRWFRLPIALVFLIFPVTHAIKDFSKYRMEYEGLTERRQRSPGAQITSDKKEAQQDAP